MQPIIKRIGRGLFRALVIATLVCLPLTVGTAAGVVIVPDATWTQTSQADFTAGTPSQVDTATSPGDIKLAKADSGYIYAFRGNGTKTFWRYNIATDNWTALADAPQTVGAGGALAYDGASYIYALGGNGTSYFWRYNITANTWSSLTATPYTVYTGGALVLDGGNYLYALRGGNKTTFWQYNISGGTWATKAPTPATVNGGGALTYGGGDYIYALRGTSNYFWQYSISGNSWTSKAATPSSVGDGGSLASDGGNYVYALKGDNTVTYWRYNISGNSWAPMADTPATPCVYGGGALVYDKNAHLFALRGNNQVDFWKYDVAGNAWSNKASAPASVAYGGALAFKGASYFSTGNLISSTYDAGYTADFWNISWTAVTSANTSVKFQIATNNDNATWVFKGPDGTAGTYYTSTGAGIWSGHYGDRYIKYKAFFSTTDTNATPTLNDISITLSHHIVLPTASTADATLVEETTATFHGAVVSDGGIACLYQFVYGTASGNYTLYTGWTGNLTTGQAFAVDVTGLGKGTKYYFRAQVKNSAGIGAGDEFNFLTKPDPPIDTTFLATVISDTQINLSWTKGEGAQKTMVRRKTGGYPADRNDGVQVYFDTGTSYSDTGLTPETLYYYSAWSEVSGSQQWSDGFRTVAAITSSTPPPTATPIVVGGVVYHVNKAEVLAPWIAASSIFTLVAGLFIVKITRMKHKAKSKGG